MAVGSVRAGQKDTSGGVQPSGAASTDRPTPTVSGPPADKPPRTCHREVADRLRAQPGTWGLVGIYPHATSAHKLARCIRNAYGRCAVYGPAGSFETRTVKLLGGSRRVEARYMPPRSDDDLWAEALAALTEDRAGGDGSG
ncbi:hypothetical protein [Streptomyces sp. LNU-CPARS28]|uniref:hypothetical protein n=1 Tax=Streptomyces sp. LNU-CPARS28 TaxID=3137371 RepID=UPI003134BCF9